MAKNVLEKKKRIAHNKTGFNDGFFEGDNGPSNGCMDYVSSIIQDMDSNFQSVQTSKVNAKSSQSGIKSTEQINAMENIATSSTSQNHSQHTNILKSKKFGLARKFPLMEKTQRTLKQLKHNRKIPKQRAHLASLSDPFPKISPVYDNSGVSVKKTKKDKQGIGSLKKSSVAPQNKSLSDKPVCNVIVPCLSKELKLSASKKLKEENRKAPCEKVEPHNIKRNSNFKDYCSSVNNLNDNVDNSSNDNLSDDEYERFVKESKKDLPKKHRKQKTSSKRKVSKKSSKKIMKNVTPLDTLQSLSSEHDSDLNDVSSASSDTYHKRSKRVKACHKVADKDKPRAVCRKVTKDTFKSSSEYDSDLGDVASTSSHNYHRNKRVKACHKVANKEKVSARISRKVIEDSEPEDILKSPEHNSDFSDAASISSQTYRRKSKRINISHKVAEEKPRAPIYCNKTESETDIFDGEIYTRDSSPESDVGGNNTSETQFTEQNNSNLTSEIHSSSDKNNASNTYSSVVTKLPTVCSESSSFDVCSAAKNDFLISTNISEQNTPSSENLMIVDLSSDESENVIPHTICPTTLPKRQENCVTANVNQNESQLHSEESDIEIINVLVYKSPETNIRCNIADNRPSFSNDYKNEFNIKTEKVNSPFVGETEKSQTILVKPKTEHENLKEIDADDKYEATYITNICQNYSDKGNISKQTLLNNVPNVSEHSLCKDILHDKNTLNSNVKKEDSDDDIIILDSVEPSMSYSFKRSCSDSSNHQNKKCEDKTETSDILTDSVVKDVNHIMEGISEIAPNSTAYQNSSKLQINKNTNIKSEKCLENLTGLKKEHPVICNSFKTVRETLTEKELKLYEVACSNLKTQNETCNVNVDKLSPIKEQDKNNLNSTDIKSLLQEFKNEFQTYQEIIQTEATIGATFKLLESRQAEKIVSLKLKLRTLLESDDNSTNIKKEMSLLFENPELSNSITLANKLELSSHKTNSGDFENTHSHGAASTAYTPDILPQDFVNVNSLSPSSIVEKDVKPNLSGLHNIPQSVQKSSTMADTLNFGEKCNVCGKEAVAACQQCAKVFFCSNECGKKYWKDGHENECGK